jgi:hypothetical protein
MRALLREFLPRKDMCRRRWSQSCKFVAVMFLLLAVASCAPAPLLKTSSAQPEEITGTYTLILYGARYGNDIEDVAVLAKEGTGYAFEVYAPEFDYKVRTHVPSREALETAQRFVSFHYAFRRSQLSAILDKKSAVIGYEVRPLYSPLDFGYADVFDILYILHENRVTVRIRLIPELDRPPFRDNNPFLIRMRD